MANHISGTSQVNGVATQARVTLINSDTNAIVSSQLSNATTGAWAFPNLPAGRYEVITLIAGYKAQVDGPWTLDGTDTYYANVVSLLHFDGADGSTTFTDQKGKVWTPSGNAQIDTAQSKFGGAALLLDGSGDFLTTPDSSDFEVTTEDFTAECWINTNVNNSVRQLLDKKGGSSGGDTRDWVFLTNASGKVQVTAFDSEGIVVSVAGATTVTTGAWHHVAFSKKGAIWRVFLDGVMDGSQTQARPPSAGAGPFTIGRDPQFTPTRDFNGWIDEMRITKGVARYVNNFVPPTAAFPNS